MSYILLRYLSHRGLVQPLALCCTLEPACDRARLARGTLDLLGLHEVPVGIGSDGGDEAGEHNGSSFSATPYMATSTRELQPTQRLLYRTFCDAAPKSLVVLVIAAMKDPALFIRDHPSLFAAKAKEVILMSGVQPPGTDGVLLPDTAHNNSFDPAASQFLYARCQELAVPLVVVSRYAAYATKAPRDVYDWLALCGSPIGWRLRNAQRNSIEGLWRRATASVLEERRGLPARCDRAWFVNAFCSGIDDPSRGGDDPIWDMVDGFMQYDSVAMLAAVPSLRAKLFVPQSVRHADTGVESLVIGASEEQPGVADAASLLEWLQQGFAEGITLNLQTREHVVLVLQPREDNASDIRLCCLMLRALWDFANIECLGIIIVLSGNEETSSASGLALSGRGRQRSGSLRQLELSSPSRRKSCEPGGASTAGPEYDEVKKTLRVVGLSHVPVHVGAALPAGAVDAPHGCNAGGVSSHGRGSDVSEILCEIYEGAPPIGLTLVLSSSVGGAAAFAQLHTTLFREKTVRLVHVGGAELVSGKCSDEEQALAPDPDAQNNRLDLLSAKRLYEIAQQLSVPMVILSRHLQRECSLPRELLDALGKAGTVGELLADEQRVSIRDLWQRVSLAPDDPARSGLPARCNRAWFEDSFCGGTPVVDDEDVWSSVVTLNVYSPIALMCALPEYIDRYFNCFSVRVRAATHIVLGVSARQSGIVSDQRELRRFLCDAFLRATLSNQSNFATTSPPIPNLGDPDSPAKQEMGRKSWIITKRDIAELAQADAEATRRSSEFFAKNFVPDPKSMADHVRRRSSAVKLQDSDLAELLSKTSGLVPTVGAADPVRPA